MGEQPLPPYGSCLLGSINLTKFVVNPFSSLGYFDWDKFKEVIKIFTRMLDNVVEINNLPLKKQRDELLRKRRHGMGFLGLGSALTMLKIPYGSGDAVFFTSQISKVLAIEGLKEGLALSKEKGPAPIMEEDFLVTEAMLKKRPEMVEDGFKVGDKVKGRCLHARYSRYMQRIADLDYQLVEDLALHGSRFTHHSSIAPTGTLALSLGNNVSNGIEPSFAHEYTRNIIKEGKKTKEAVSVASYELLAYRQLVNAGSGILPDYFVTSEDLTPEQHVDMQAAAQYWVDSSISKTINVPTDMPYEDFKNIYLYAYKKGLKGCATFRFNPEVHQGVLVKNEDLEKTEYQFTLADGQVVTLKGNEELTYDGETHTAANLYEALKEGYYGRL